MFAKATLDPLENRGKIEPKSMKNRAQGAQNPSRFDLAVPNPCQIVARSCKSMYVKACIPLPPRVLERPSTASGAADLGVYFGAQNGVEICEIPLKLEENSDIVCTYRIIMIFHGF